MPIINIQTLPVSTHVDTAAVLQEVVKALSHAINTPCERIHAGWTYYHAQADGLDIEGTFRQHTHPPIVSIDLFQGRTKEQKVNAQKAIAAVLKKELAFEGHPFIHMRDIANAHVMTGGEVIDKS